MLCYVQRGAEDCTSQRMPPCHKYGFAVAVAAAKRGHEGHEGQTRAQASSYVKSGPSAPSASSTSPMPSSRLSTSHPSSSSFVLRRSTFCSSCTKHCQEHTMFICCGTDAIFLHSFLPCTIINCPNNTLLNQGHTHMAERTCPKHISRSFKPSSSSSAPLPAPLSPAHAQSRYTQ